MGILMCVAASKKIEGSSKPLYYALGPKGIKSHINRLNLEAGI